LILEPPGFEAWPAIFNPAIADYFYPELLSFFVWNL